VNIRRAKADDAPVVASTLYEAFAEFRAFYTPLAFAATAISAAEVRARMAEGPLWVALSDDSICGTVGAFAQESAVLVRGMAVLAIVRGRRIGEALLKQTEVFAIEHGHQSLRLTTTPFLHSAIRLYERFGFCRVPGDSAELFGTPVFWMEKKLKSPTE